MKAFLTTGLLTAAALPAVSAAAAASCISSGNQDTINQVFSRGGPNTKVQLCPGAVIMVTDSIRFTADGQEISTQGYPTGSTRAIIRIQPGSSVSSIISSNSINNVAIRNLELDGNRPNAGFIYGGGATIEIGGRCTGQVIDHVKSHDPRGWSCMHVIGSGIDNNPCTNATITNNDIGPCGESGTDADGHGKWSDGISLDCTNSLVQDNTVNGPTDGGIVIFGSPGSTINRNTIISSSVHEGWGGINAVDPGYHASFKDVTVSNNVIQGSKLLHVGIAMGSFAWSFNNDMFLQGPTKFINNKFSGNIAFPMGLNGWSNGITVTGNSAIAVNLPRSSFADASNCVPALQQMFKQNANMIYYPNGVSGSKTLQSEFKAASGNTTNFLCATAPLPTSLTFQRGSIDIPNDGPPFATVQNLIFQFQSDLNVVGYSAGNPVWANMATLPAGQGCQASSGCRMQFTSQGELTTTYQGQVRWSSKTAGKGQTLVVINNKPWMQIKDASGNVIWDTTRMGVSLV